MHNIKVEQILQSTNDFIKKILGKLTKFNGLIKEDENSEVIEIPFEEFKNSMIKKLENNDDKCVICVNPLRNKRVLDCGHEFCIKCTKKWRNINNNCPICRKNIVILS